jgi:hypothetical protein
MCGQREATRQLDYFFASKKIFADFLHLKIYKDPSAGVHFWCDIFLRPQQIVGVSGKRTIMMD